MILNHIISAAQFDTKSLEEIFRLTDRIREGIFDRDVLKRKIMASLFYEPSTRTRLSFESAMHRLGGSVISTENAGEFSSAAKGETLEDTIRVVNSYCDLIVLRHYNPGASEIAAKFSTVPVINAGDGEGEHPTQALLDLYTIFSKNKKSHITISMVGDLTFGRTIHSLCILISLYSHFKIIFVSPKALSVPSAICDLLNKKKVDFSQTEDLQKALKVSDVIYQTRIQKERFQSQSEYQKYKGLYILGKSSLEYLRKDALIMHPLPRVKEISVDVDSDKRAIYFEQARYGVYVRMALLILLFDKNSLVA